MCFLCRLSIRTHNLVFAPYQVANHRPALSNFLGEITLYREGFIASFVNISMAFLHLEVPLLGLSRGESIHGIFEEMTLISLECEDKIGLFLDNLFSYFYLRTHGIHRDDDPLKGKPIEQLGYTCDFVGLLSDHFLGNA